MKHSYKLLFLLLFATNTQLWGQINSLQIEYTFTSNIADGQTSVAYTILYDDGKTSLYITKDTTTNDGSKVIQVPLSPKNYGLYIDKANDDLIVHAPVFNKDYYLKEDSISALFHWQLVDSVRKTVLGYDCTLAICRFRGREYRAYYTKSLPFFAGPWKLNGLPGVILEAVTTDGLYIFTAIKVDVNTIKQPLANPYIKIKGPFISFIKHKQLFLQKIRDWQKKAQSEEKDDDVTYSFKDTSIELLNN